MSTLTIRYIDLFVDPVYFTGNTRALIWPYGSVSFGGDLVNASNLFEQEAQDVALRAFDDLRKLREVVDWKAFHLLLQEIFGRPRCSSWDVMVMFQVLLPGSERPSVRTVSCSSSHSLDRRSFKHCTGLLNGCDVQDQKNNLEISQSVGGVGSPEGVVWDVRDTAAECRLCNGGRSDRQLDDGGDSQPGANTHEENAGAEARQGSRSMEGDLPQADAEGCGCDMDEEARVELLCLQELRDGGPQAQADARLRDHNGIDP